VFPANPQESALLKSLILGSAAALLCCVCAGADESSVGEQDSKPLLAAIKKVSPNATILQAKEVDTKSCGPTPKSPGLVRADFNGDGLDDAAVLLKTFVSSEITIWESQELRRADFLFVIFLNDGKGGYLARPLDKFPGHIPAGAFIDLETSGKIRPLGAKKDVTLSNPAIVLTYCEKSAAAYVATGTRIKEIPLSD